jgi:signal peptidase I
LQLPQRAKPQFYSVALDGKTPINFEYLLKDLDITDQVYYKNNDKRYFAFRALTVAGAARLKIY